MNKFEKHCLNYLLSLIICIWSVGVIIVYYGHQNKQHFKALQQQIESATVVDTIRIEKPQTTASQYGVQPYTNKVIGHDQRTNHTTGHY